MKPTRPGKLLPTLGSALLVLGLMLFSPAGGAFAHNISPQTASPAPGEILEQAPSQVRLTFEEELNEEGSSLQVFDLQGKQVDLGSGGVDLFDAQHAALVVDLPQLAPGAYNVRWRAALADGDASEGAYTFGVGDVILPENPQPGEAGPAEQGAAPGERWLLPAVFGALLLAAAGVFLLRSRRTS